MNKLEPALIRSFRNVKSDVVRLQGDMLFMGQTQEKLIEELKELSSKLDKLNAKELHVKKSNGTVHRRQFVASKEGKKFHTKNCPYAKNIKPKSKLIFLSKVKALNQGLKPCTCVA
jgi:hypothetical protein